MKYEANAYSTYVDGHYWTWMTNGNQIGWLFTILAVVGVVVLVRRSSTRVLSIGWLVFAVPFLTYLISQMFQPVRNLMPLLPFLAVAAAAGLLEAVRLLGRALSLGRSARIAASVGLTLVLVASMFFGGVSAYLRRSTDVVDSRTEAVEWLKDEVGPDQTVLVVEELAILPAELDRIPGHVTVAPAYKTAEPSDLGSFDFVVTASFRPGPYAPGAVVWTPPATSTRPRPSA